MAIDRLSLPYDNERGLPAPVDVLGKERMSLYLLPSVGAKTPRWVSF